MAQTKKQPVVAEPMFAVTHKPSGTRDVRLIDSNKSPIPVII